MRTVAFVIVILLLGAVAIVAFAPSTKVQDAALAPITVTPSDPIEPAPAGRQLPPPVNGAVPPDEDSVASASAPGAEAGDGAMSPAAAVTDPLAAQACEEELKALGVTFEPQSPIFEEGGCGAERPLLVSSVGIALKPAVTTRCHVAKALAIWTKDVLVPSAKLHLKTAPTAILTGDSYLCRARRGGGETKVSEHALANAIDVSGIELTGREPVAIKERAGTDDGAMAFQAAIRGGACAYFTTVLGPGTNAAHADHLHVDLIQRSSGYRICE